MTGPATCGAKTRTPDRHPCRKPAGWGTPTPGFGRCRLHGGATPAGKVNAARLEAKAAAALGAEVDLDPTAALELAVRLVGGEVAFLRGKLREAEEAGDEAAQRALAGIFAASVERLARVGKVASDADVAEARLRLDSLVLDKLGSAVSAAIEDAGLDPDARARLDTALHQRLGELRDDDLRSRPRELAP